MASIWYPIRKHLNIPKGNFFSFVLELGLNARNILYIFNYIGYSIFRKIRYKSCTM